MDSKDLSVIQSTIAYKFRNVDLLRQAFIRRSYSKENGGENNEVLEFIGDKVLDFIVVKILSERFGVITNSEFREYQSEYQEHELTELKKHLVEKRTLAERIDQLDLAQYLIMGRGDQKNHIDESTSVKEDLFEAILGAIAIDSNYNIKEMQDAVEEMLNPDLYIFEEDINYIDEIQHWSLRKCGELPKREFREHMGSLWANVPGVLTQAPPPHAKYECFLQLNDFEMPARAYGTSKREAHETAAKLLYDELEKRGILFTIRDEIDEPTITMAINQLETLARRGYFSLPEYKFEQQYDENGNPVWYVECHITEMEYYYFATANSKKQAKKEAAYDMLLYVLDHYEAKKGDEGWENQSSQSTNRFMI